ncbi:MAG: P-loop NTPase fold protein [Novosphingobium sp.]
MHSAEELWSDDKLGRRAEAEMLKEVLETEARECSRMGREQAFVLALDAAYGEGKTFFLTKLRKYLSIEHPVAFIDAWADDASDEPLLAIMSSINEALEPFLKPGSNATKWLKGATAAALPIIGKLVIGAGKTFLKKHIGDEIPDQVEALVKEKSGVGPGLEEDTILGAIDDAAVNISNLTDKRGAEMLAAYKARQASKETFKRSMRLLVSSIDDEENKISQPLFVIIDELDRCRPDYAIKVLEEVKHLFDIPGVVFIIAIHGDQLEKSIAAVYGADFDAKSYLHRFFSRRYKLRRLTMKEMIASRLAADNLDKINWNYPRLMSPSRAPADPDLVGVIQAFCSDFGVTPREFSSIADGLRIFGLTWNQETAIELVYLLGLLLRNARSLQSDSKLESKQVTEIHGGWDEGGRSSVTNFDQLWRSYEDLKLTALFDLSKANYRLTNGNIVVDALESERAKRFGNRVVPDATSLMNSYPDRVAQFGRLLTQA